MNWSSGGVPKYASRSAAVICPTEKQNISATTNQVFPLQFMMRLRYARTIKEFQLLTVGNEKTRLVGCFLKMPKREIEEGLILYFMEEITDATSTYLARGIWVLVVVSSHKDFKRTDFSRVIEME